MFCFLRFPLLIFVALISSYGQFYAITCKSTSWDRKIHLKIHQSHPRISVSAGDCNLLFDEWCRFKNEFKMVAGTNVLWYQFSLLWLVSPIYNNLMVPSKRICKELLLGPLTPKLKFLNFVIFKFENMNIWLHCFIKQRLYAINNMGSQQAVILPLLVDDWYSSMEKLTASSNFPTINGRRNIDLVLWITSHPNLHELGSFQILILAWEEWTPKTKRWKSHFRVSLNARKPIKIIKWFPVQ